MEPDLVWSACLGELQLQMTQATFDTWLRGAKFVAYEEGTFVIGVKNGYAKDWLDHRLLPTIKRTLCRLTGSRESTVRLVVYEPDALPRPPAGQEDAPESAAAPLKLADDQASAKVRLEREYGDARMEILQPDQGLWVQSYFLRRHIARLGPERAAVVELLRDMAKKADGPPDESRPITGTRPVETDCVELATILGMGVESVRNYLRCETIPNDESGARRIKGTGKEPSPADLALREFIPKIYLVYYTGERRGQKGRVFHIRMDDPLTPEDEARMHEMAVAKLAGEERGPADEVRDMIQTLDMSAADGRTIRWLVLPIAKATAKLLDDEHSTKMYHNVLKELYRANRLDLYLEALEMALLATFPGANQGAIFVKEIRDLGEAEGVPVRFKG